MVNEVTSLHNIEKKAMRSIFEMNKVHLFLYDKGNDSITLMTQSEDKMTFEVESLIGGDSVYPLDKKRVREFVEGLRGDKRSDIMEIRWHKEIDDEFTWLRITYVKEQEGDSDIVLLSTQDINEEKMAKESMDILYGKLLEDDAKLERAILWHALYSEFYMLVVIDAKSGKGKEMMEHPVSGAIRYINIEDIDRNTQLYFEKTAEEECKDDVIKRTRLSKIVSELEAQDHYNVIFKGKNVKGQIRDFSVDFSYIDRASGMICCSVSDITEIVANNRIQREAIKMSMEREELAREAKDNFLANMSHEIRTPLNAIVGMAEIAKLDLYNPAKVKECMDVLLNSSQELVNVVSNILDSSNFQSGNIKLVENVTDVRDLLNTVADEFNSIYKKNGQSFIMNIDVQHGRAMLDKDRLKRVLLNILSNAAKFSDNHGVITLDVSEKEGHRQGHGYYVFSIKDNGRGIDNEDLEHVFEPFYRDKESANNYLSGTGLGLAVVKNILDAKGADVKIESELGVGTVVRVTDPVKFIDVHEQVPTSVKKVLEGCKVLLVEDQPINMLVAKRMLERFGAEVHTAEHGRFALEQFMKHPANTYDFIFMDIQMPIMDGYEATRKIREAGREDSATVKIISMTADVLAEDVEKSREAGMNAHIGKPIRSETLQKLIIALQGN